MKIKKNKIYIAGGLFVILVVVIGIIIGQFFPQSSVTYPNIISARPILGNPTASIKVIEYSDIQCPACKFAATYPQRLENEFGDKISIEFKHFPLSFHKFAFDAAMAAECANDQGKFWEFLEMGFSNQDKLTKTDLKKYAKELGLNTSSFNACLDTSAKREIVDEHMREGYAKGIPGTPTFFVNDKMITTVNYDDIKAEIENQLKK